MLPFLGSPKYSSSPPPARAHIIEWCAVAASEDLPPFAALGDPRFTQSIIDFLA